MKRPEPPQDFEKTIQRVNMMTPVAPPHSLTPFANAHFNSLSFKAKDSEGCTEETCECAAGHCAARAEQGGGTQFGQRDTAEQLYKASLGHGPKQQ